jgi:hypothetical protein
LDAVEWNDGKSIPQKDNHTLAITAAITANGKTIFDQLPDEWRADYPGRAGEERTNGQLSELIRQFK